MAARFGAKSLATALLWLGALHALSACISPVPLILTAATVTAIDINLDRRTLGRYLDDNSLEPKLRNSISRDEALGGDVNVSVTVVNGIVLLTGEVKTDAQRQRAGELAERYEATRKVVNELTLAGKTNFTSRINDSWITTKAKLKLLNSPNISASTVKVVTEHGRVYLLGIVTKTEAESAVEAIRATHGVTHVVKVFEYIE